MLGVVFGLALLVRVLYLAQLARNPDYSVPLFDAQGYTMRADQWIRGRGLSPEVFEFSLLYHLALSALFFVTDSSLWIARGVQAALGALSAAWLARITARWVGPRAGYAAGLLAALYAPAFIGQSELVPVALECLWFMAVLEWGAAPGHDAAGRAACFSRGLVGGLGILLGPRHGVAWFAVLLVARRRAGSAPSRARCGWMFAGFALPLGVAMLLLGGRLMTPETLVRGASNLHLGNSGDLCKTLAMRPGPDYQEFMAGARRSAGAESIGLPRYFLREISRELAGDPLRFARGLGAKALHLVSSREIPAAMDIRALRDAVPIARPLFFNLGPIGFPFAVAIVLGTFGLALRRKGAPAPLLALLIVPALWLIATRVTSLDRLPWAMLWLSPAGAAVAALWPGRAGPHPPGLRYAALPAGAALALAVLPGPFCVEAAQGRAERLRAIGQYHLLRYDIARAAPYFDQALAHDPHEVQALNGAGVCRQLRGQAGEARALFERAIARKPGYALALFNLAGLEAAQGRPDVAARHLERGLALQPENGQAHNELGALYAAMGRPAEAIPHFELAVRINPDVLDPRLGLASALGAAGRAEEAEALLRAALKLAPLDSRIHVLMGFLLLRRGADGAEGHFLAARAHDPEAPGPYYGLALYHSTAGRAGDARAAWDAARARDPDRAAYRALVREAPALAQWE